MNVKFLDNFTNKIYYENNFSILIDGFHLNCHGRHAGGPVQSTKAPQSK